MSDTPESRAAYFDALYAHNADPWHFRDGEYEIAKRDVTLAALPRQRYARGCEVGCSIGVLTAQLAPRVDVLVGIDIAEAAAAAARIAVAGFPHVQIDVLHMPQQLPVGHFDLLMLSEVLYFFTQGELVALADFAARQVVPSGDVVIVSFDGETHTTLTGGAATAVFTAAAAPHFETIRDDVHDKYHIRILRRRHD